VTIRLSICIATLNRADVIGATLQSIASQLAESTELVVVDGASTDATESVVESFTRANPRIRYTRLPANSGVDRDFNTAVEVAAGEYCWLMSDDDLLKPGAIGSVLRALDSHPSLVIVNAETRTPDLARILKGNMLGISGDEIYAPDDWESFFVRAGQYLSFIGCVVIRRDLWMSRDREAYFGTLFVHVGVIFQKRLPRAAIILAAPLISIRYGNAMWTPRSLEIWMVKWPDLVWSFPDFSDSAKRRVYRRSPYLRLSTLALFRAKGALTTDAFRKTIAPRVASDWLRWAGYLIAATPGVLMNAAVTAYLKIRSPNEAMPLFELQASPYHFSRSLGRRKGTAQASAAQ
jgi:abequosyltransferase